MPQCSPSPSPSTLRPTSMFSAGISLLSSLGRGYFAASIPTVGLLTKWLPGQCPQRRMKGTCVPGHSEHFQGTESAVTYPSASGAPGGFSGNTQKPQPPPPHPPTFPGDVPSPRTTLLFPYPRRSGPKPGRSCAKLGPFSHVRLSSLVFRIRSKKPIRSTPTPGTPRLAPHTAPPWGARGSDLRAREWDPTGCYWFSSPAVAVVQIGVSSAREDDEEKSRQKQKSSLEQDTTVPGIH